ncbi:MAG: hypothetical protein OEW73_02555 [Gammaproteobacteria bacterium]|nr:hypothetical protein [Gammaproteobacteria bacterium]MDH5239646.1 hypothetical protein [Gammaproteobacteria bacterium]
MFGLRLVIVTASFLVAATGAAWAEPYLAVQKGMQCSTCHFSPAGGGKRNVYGNVFAQSELAARRLGDGKLWTGELNKWISVGANLRGSFVQADIPNRSTTSDSQIDRGTVYLKGSIIPNRVTVYVDQQVAPDDSINREAYLRINSKNTKWFATIGRSYLPYGLRLQDDSTFVRLATGANFANSDRGIQAGYNFGPWSIIGSVTEPEGSSSSSTREFSVVSTYVQAAWRAGFSANQNNDDAGERNMFGLFGGLKTGPIAWLAEVDTIRDEISPGRVVRAFAGLLEANWTFWPHHNLKVGYDYLDPNDDISEDHQVRYSVAWEHSPFQFFQARAGYRLYDGIPQVDTQNRKVFFVELHGFF